jgi:hypothetical protein
MANKYIPRPENRREFMNKLVKPTDPTTGNPNQIYSETVRPGEPEFNRGYQISEKGDTDINVSVGIKDIDEAVLYYFLNVIKPSVTQNNIRRDVPVIYGSPERWKSVQADGYYKDFQGKIQVPLIMFKRDSIEKNRDLGNKLDGNKVHNLIVVQKGFNRRNAYDNFAVLTNRVPQKEYIVAFPPDYVTVTYSCVIFTDFVEQMDKLVEAISFASDSYWGDPTKYQFRAKIDSYSTQTALEYGNDRAVKSTFNIILNGYIIPDSINKEVASANRVYSTSQVIFGFEAAGSAEEFVATTNKSITQTSNRRTIAAIAAADSINVSLTQNITNISPDSLVYINTNVNLTGTVTGVDTATFNAGWLIAPAGLPATSVDNFTFFCNGQFVEKTAVISFTELNSISTLVIDTAALGFTLSNGDEVVAIGKFNI